MWKLVALILLITTLLSTYKWIATKIALDILTEYAYKQGCTPPSEKELAEYTEAVRNRILEHLLRK